MNDKLVRILERYELDKPILMSDKLDIIWDKNENSEVRKEGKSRKPVITLDDAKNQYQDLMKKTARKTMGQIEEDERQRRNRIIHAKAMKKQKDKVRPRGADARTDG